MSLLLKQYKEGGTLIMVEKKLVIGDAIQMLSDEIAEEEKISKCAAIAIVGGVLLNEKVVKELNIDPEVQYEIKKHIAASCIGDSSIIFEGLHE